MAPDFLPLLREEIRELSDVYEEFEAIKCKVSPGDAVVQR
jgi:hypothetical protein